MMMAYYRLLRSHWFRSLLGIIMLSVLIWYFGPALGFGEVHPFDSTPARIIAIGLLIVLWLLLNLWADLHAARKDRKLAEGVAAPDPQAEAKAETQAASAEEVAVLTARLKTALQDLRRAKLGGRSGRRLYQLPWYLFIGPPGAGKTTALTKSGLRFPLADEAAPTAIGGVGGTRHCDWWFTDEAVLIDTAGRYTTQDSHAAVDAAAWTGFLRLLKKHRGRQPLNGVLLAISLSDLSTLSDTERRAHALAMRRRLRELHDELGVRGPVYVLFTKADLIAGFIEFFDNLGREEREQVWGTTFPLDTGTTPGGAVEGFTAAFDGLLARLNDRMLERMSQETDIQRRRLIYGFPQQVASLRDIAAEFLDEIFRPSKLEPRALLRGVYLTSGTQDGTPIDRLLGAMAGQFGLTRQAVTAFSGSGRSYFLGRLLRDVVFREAALVSTDPKVEFRARWLSRGAYAAAAASVLVLGGLWTMSYLNNLALIAALDAQAKTYAGQYKAVAALGDHNTDLPPILPPLSTLRALPGGYQARDTATPISLTFGLYQGGKLGAAAVDAYHRGLDAMLLPRLLSRLETEIRANLDKPPRLYGLLKVYLMLGRLGPLDPGLVLDWLTADLEAAFPGDDAADGRDAMVAHAAAMLDLSPLPAVALDGPLIDQARAVLTQEPPARYAYDRILHLKKVRELPEWTVADNAGAEGSRVFQARTHKNLKFGVPGIYTNAGYHDTFLPILPVAIAKMADDDWVLGLPSRDVGASMKEKAKMHHDIIGMYLDDYTFKWDALLGEIVVRPFGNLQAGVEELNLLAAPDSPLRDLMKALDVQTQLSHESGADQAASRAESGLAKMGKKAAGLAKIEGRMGLSKEENEIGDILSEGFGTDSATGKRIDPATYVDEHFSWIHDFVFGKEGLPSPMEAAIGKINAMYQNFAQIASSANQGQALLGVAKGGGGGGGGGGGSPADQLQAMAQDLPKPVAAMLQTVSKSGAGVTSSGASKALSDAWATKVLPLCRAAFDRYPFLAGQSDVPADDFAHLLGPGGLMESFFNDNLAPLVDTTRNPWGWQSADHVALGLSPATLTEFQNADKIKRALFSAGNQMQVRFRLTSTHLDRGLSHVSVDIAGQTMVGDFGPQEATSFTWPNNGKTLVRVTLTPAQGGGDEKIIEYDGDWALLHLIDQARVIPSGEPDRFQIVFGSPWGNATFAVVASSVWNPFTLGALRSFRCPAHL